MVRRNRESRAALDPTAVTMTAGAAAGGPLGETKARAMRVLVEGGCVFPM